VSRNGRGILEIKQRLILDDFELKEDYSSTEFFIFYIDKGTFFIQSAYAKNSWAQQSHIKTKFRKASLVNICKVIESNPELLIKQLKLTSEYLVLRSPDKHTGYKQLLDLFNKRYGDLIILM
jgi:hypothetical protein